ncbi:hypothetical protein ACYJAM_004753 [Escherichia coli]
MSGISINTRQLADLLGNHKAKVRKFNLTAALRFVDQVNKARSEGGNSESS